MIRRVRHEDIPACADIIRKSFMTVAEEFGFTPENAPRFTAFAINEEKLLGQLADDSRLMFLYESGGIPVGYYSLLLLGDGECELDNLAVLPGYRHRGIGKELLFHAFETARKAGRFRLNIGIVEENAALRKWYESSGAVHTGTKKFDFFPFTCGYMVKEI